MKTTQYGNIAKGVGFRELQGEVRRAVTRKHSKKDEGQTFKDNFGRKYTYTLQGLIY
jgi:hypothetical protein